MTQLMKKSDAELKQHVIQELKWDNHVNETRIGVEFENGVVTLTGIIEHYAERMAAQDAAHRVGGVLDVVNNIQVRYTGTRTDSDIARAVRHALEWDIFVPEERIKSTVSNGVVTLEGEVDDYSQLGDVARSVRMLTGVQNIINKIHVKAAVAPSDLRRTIEEALERHASRTARDITLEVHDGKVILKGTVPSCAERAVVLGAARGTRGVRIIDDRLTVLP
jgi:osmotically-inducible protein OsmY